MSARPAAGACRVPGDLQPLRERQPLVEAETLVPGGAQGEKPLLREPGPVARCRRVPAGAGEVGQPDTRFGHHGARRGGQGQVVDPRADAGAGDAFAVGADGQRLIGL